MTTRADREAIAKKRLLRILEGHTIANARTLEQKISDAGPYGQRIQPHILTGVRNSLVDQGQLVRVSHAKAPWFHLPDAPAQIVKARLDDQLPIYRALTHGALAPRIGQTLEIATYRALCSSDLEFYGRFKDLNAHADDQMYSKEEPPQHIGNRQLDGDERLDFMIRHPDAGSLGIEYKNIREWLYPDREEITETLQKCVALDCIPVFIARRIPFVTFMLLTTCGAIVHQTYNQLLPESDEALAANARNKTLLGYHDIRVGNQPDARLQKFIIQNLPTIAASAREKFENYKDLLGQFASREYSYAEFAARVRRRSQGRNEDHDWEDDEQEPEY